MKKLLSLAAICIIILTGCGVDISESLQTFQTNFESADSVLINYQSAKDNFTLQPGDKIAFSDLDTLTYLNFANTDGNDYLTYDEAYTVAQEQLDTLESNLESYRSRASKDGDNTVVKFNTEGMLNEDATGTDTYTFSDNGNTLKYESLFEFANGEEADPVTITLTLK